VLIKLISGNQWNLKIFYSISSICCEALLQPTLDAPSKSRALEILKKVDQLDRLSFGKCLNQILKHTPSSQEKDQLIEKLSHGTSMVQKFGDKEYSLLAALGSQTTSVRKNAVHTLTKPALLKTMNKEEVGLAKLFLIQLVLSGNEDSEILELVFTSFLTMIETCGDSDSNDLFSISEHFLHSCFSEDIQGARYSASLIEKVERVALLSQASLGHQA
jgi:hypothetical protein